jgi:hypothetical protein
VSKKPFVLVFEYEIDGERAADAFITAVDVLRTAIASMPPLAQPFNVTAMTLDDADRATRALFDRPCLPPGQTVEGRSGEAP